MEKFMGMDVTNEYNGVKIRTWLLNKTRKIDDIFGPYINTRKELNYLEKQEAFLQSNNVPFITTEHNKTYTIWKEQKADHVR